MMNPLLTQFTTLLLVFSGINTASADTWSLCSYDDYNLALVVKDASGPPPESQVEAALELLGDRMATISNERYDTGDLPFGVGQTDFSLVSVEFEAGQPFDRFNVLVTFSPRIEYTDAATCAPLHAFNEALTASFSLDYVYAVRDMKGGDYFSKSTEAAVYNTKCSTDNLSRAPTPSPTPSPTDDLLAKIVATPSPTSAPTKSIVSATDADVARSSGLRGSSPNRSVRIRSYDEFFLSLVVPGATVGPTDSQAKEALEVLSDDFIEFVNAGFNDKVLHFNIEKEELMINSIEFEQGIPHAEFNVLIKFVPAIECFADAISDQCPTQTEFEQALMESVSVKYIFDLQQVGDGYFSDANEAILRKSAKADVATQAPVATPAPSASPSAATNGDQALSKTFRSYEDHYLAIGAPDVDVLPSDAQAKQVIGMLGAAFIDNANSEHGNNVILDVDFSLESVELGAGIPAEKYNILVKFSPGVECSVEEGGCLSETEFRSTLFGSFSEKLLYAVRDLEGGFFSSLKEGYLLSSKSKEFADHDDDRRLQQQGVWLHL